MPNLLKSRKAQFFIVSVIAIITTLFFVSRWIEPRTIIDTSSVVLMDEPFVFNNIIEKAIETVKKSKDCEELFYNLDEYRSFVVEFCSRKNIQIDFNFDTRDCTDADLKTYFDIILYSPKATLKKSFIATKV